MAGTLLLRGMLIGIVAGLLCFSFLKIVGEPQVDRAIAFETQLDEAKAGAAAQALIANGLPVLKEEPEPELVSRRVQAGIGLFTGVLVYNVAFGGLFALAFGLAYGRMGDFDPRTTAALLAALGFIAVYIVPNLKYPANPPSVGEPATIGMRTALYFSMIAISLAAMIAAGMLRLRLLAGHGPWNAFLIAAGAYLIVVVAVCLGLPPVNEVPAEFPAVVLWRFRIASAGAQLITWTTIGLLFGALAEHVLARPRGAVRYSGKGRRGGAGRYGEGPAERSQAPLV
ncbi:MAG: CbtA family protein [Alphaproteobacteria bacterium]|nr:CbtA family protein [Alphaproteobacteria bacterium]MBV9373952.1 CbtA family protein [Alphaproteobacteria bacterium]